MDYMDTLAKWMYYKYIILIVLGTAFMVIFVLPLVIKLIVLYIKKSLKHRKVMRVLKAMKREE